MRRFLFIAFFALPLAAQEPRAIRAHMRFLADDLLEGRGTATRGQEIAARYIASQFESLGLATTLQTVPLRRSTVIDASLGDLKFGTDFLVVPAFVRERDISIGKDAILLRTEDDDKRAPWRQIAAVLSPAFAWRDSEPKNKVILSAAASKTLTAEQRIHLVTHERID